MLWGSQQFDKLDEEQATPLDLMEKGFNLLHRSVVLFAPFSLIYCSWLQKPVHPPGGAWGGNSEDYTFATKWQTHVEERPEAPGDH